ncbi:unnamed protein product [Scytosiphon promiscuus]
MYNVGEKVRIATGRGKSCRGLILYVGSSADGNPTYDVLLQSPDPATTAVAAAASASSLVANPKGNDSPGAADDDEDAGTDGELTGQSASDLSSLESFELEACTVDKGVRDGAVAAVEDVFSVAESLKDGGNTLFKLGDTDAAAEIFVRVLNTLERTPVVGATVLVRTTPTVVPATPTRYRSGMISDANNDDGPRATYDVIYDEDDAKTGGRGEMQGDEEDEDEEDGVSAERVLGVPACPSIWCAARLNLARCSFRGGRHSEVVEASTLVLSLARLTMAEKQRPREERAKLRTHCLTALRMRGGSHLAQNHIGQARKDARSMMRSAGENEESRAQAVRFETEVERKAKMLLKTNRKLAKDVTRWVDASMAEHEEARLKDGDEPLPAPPSQSVGHAEGSEPADSGVEESKGSDGGGGVKSWLGGWVR